MRYLKVLVLAIFLFLALIFFFQNQAPLSQQMEMSLNLFFLPTMTSIPLPFYFLLISAFFVGCLLTLFWLIWDKFICSSRLMQARWRATNLHREVDKLRKLLEETTAKANAEAAARNSQADNPENLPAVAVMKSEPTHSSDAPADEMGKETAKRK